MLSGIAWTQERFSGSRAGQRLRSREYSCRRFARSRAGWSARLWEANRTLQSGKSSPRRGRELPRREKRREAADLSHSWPIQSHRAGWRINLYDELVPDILIDWLR